MLHINDHAHFLGVMRFALEVGAVDKLLDKLEYLHEYADGTNTCELHPDWAPHSFAFVMKRPDGSTWFSGGLIYHGPGQPGDGSAPALTVSLAADKELHSWGIHT